MSMINYGDSTITHWEIDDNGEKVSVPMLNESHQVIGNKFVLEGIPDEQYRVFIEGMVEINIKEKIIETNQFKVDYRKYGTVFVHPSLDGQWLDVNKYSSRGMIFIPSSKIWTKIDDFGNVIETLDSVVTKIELVSDIIADLDQSIDTAKGLKTELSTTISTGGTTKSSLDESITIATTKKSDLDSSISTSTTSKLNLDTSITDANTSKSNLDASISNSTTSKTNLDSSISSGNTLKTNLDGSISTGTTLKSNLDVNITDGNKLKVDLPLLTTNANTAKTNLDGSIATSITKKSELDGSIDSATTKKTDLDSSVSSANTINNTLSNSTTGTIKKANDANSTLNTSISNSASSKTALDGSITTAGTSKANLDASVATANTTKTGLDGSITTGNTLKGELDDIISGIDYEQVIIDVNSMKQDQHSHTNKTTLDGLSDVSGKLKYNGQDVGVGDMVKSIYDIDGDGKVDIANNSEKLGGQLPSHYAKQSDLANKVDNSRVLTDVPEGAKFTDTIYTHPTTAGNKHIPAGGSVGQILKNTASGTATWQAESVTPIANNLTETVAGKALDATQGKVLDDKIGILSGNLIDLEYSELSSNATNIDNEGVYKNIEWKRKNNTLYAKSTLLGTSPTYNQIKVDYYNETGTTIIKTITWNLTYDDNGFPHTRMVV